MKSTKTCGTPVWVAVKVLRGFVYEAQIFEKLSDAMRTKRRWKQKCNPDYDEIDVVQTRLKISLPAK
jgi:hypothetical protein